MTTAYQAYIEGRKARKLSSERPKYNPFSVGMLVYSWSEGWADENAGIENRNWDCLGGRCPICGYSGMIDRPDGILRCRQSPCRERNYLPHDRQKVQELKEWEQYRISLGERAST